MIDDSEPLREVYGEAVEESRLAVHVFSWDEADEWRALAGLPESVALTGWDLVHRAGTCRPYADGVSRVLILVDVPTIELPTRLLDRPGVAALPLPFRYEELDLALRWLAWETLEPEWEGAETPGASVEAPMPNIRSASPWPRGRRWHSVPAFPGPAAGEPRLETPSGGRSGGRVPTAMGSVRG